MRRFLETLERSRTSATTAAICAVAPAAKSPFVTCGQHQSGIRVGGLGGTVGDEGRLSSVVSSDHSTTRCILDVRASGIAPSLQAAGQAAERRRRSTSDETIDDRAETCRNAGGDRDRLHARQSANNVRLLLPHGRRRPARGTVLRGSVSCFTEFAQRTRTLFLREFQQHDFTNCVTDQVLQDCPQGASRRGCQTEDLLAAPSNGRCAGGWS